MRTFRICFSKSGVCGGDNMKFKCRRVCSRFRESACWCTLIAAACGVLVIILFLSGFSLLMTQVDAPDGLVSCMASIALCAGSFTAGFVGARRRRKRGIWTGICCGFLIYLVVFFFGLLLLRSFSGAGTFMKLILILLCSAIGGVCGVNTRICRPPRL